MIILAILASITSFMNDMIRKADEFITIDQNIEFEEEMTEQEIVNIVLGQSEVKDVEDVEKTSDPPVVWKTHLNIYNKKFRS